MLCRRASPAEAAKQVTDALLVFHIDFKLPTMTSRRIANTFLASAELPRFHVPFMM